MSEILCPSCQRQTMVDYGDDDRLDFPNENVVLICPECGYNLPARIAALESELTKRLTPEQVEAMLAEKTLTVERENTKIKELLSVALCPNCDGSGATVEMIQQAEYVTQEMANDAGQPERAGERLRDNQYAQVECEWCHCKKALLATDKETARKPTVVCLCGSTRFKDTFDEANYQETMAGKIVLSVGFFMHASGNKHGEGIGATTEQKVALDELHKRKIDLADEVLILNVGGYIGSSTRSELEYAKAHGKRIRFLEATAKGEG